MGKVVQTTLEDEEYRVLKETLDRRKLTLREGLKLAIAKFLKDEIKLDPRDPFFIHRSIAKSGLKDLSKEHDKYLYCEEKSQE